MRLSRQVDDKQPAIRFSHLSTILVYAMNAKRLTRYQQQLLTIRDRLSTDTEDLRHDIEDNQKALLNREAYVADEIETDTLLSKNEEGLLAEVHSALARIESGAYGDCLDCGNTIPADRLNVIPYTPYCIGCEEKREATG